MTTLHIDPSHSGVHFSVRHMMISKVRGAFTRFGGSIAFDEADPTRSQLDVRIEAASVDTREPKRDEHLRSPDFFDVARFPELRFVSTGIERLGGDRYRVAGELTLHGVTRPVALDAELLGRQRDPWGNERVGFQATARINRKDYGLGWNQALETGGILVGEDVDISLEVEAVHAQAEQVA